MNPPGGSIRHYAPFIGLRYSFSRKRNSFTSVIAMVSMLGMVIGVASLITVLSVMNGFGGELRQRILSLVPHGYVAHGDAGISVGGNWPKRCSNHPGLLRSHPTSAPRCCWPARPTCAAPCSPPSTLHWKKTFPGSPATIIAGSLESLGEDGFHVVLGVSLARILRVAPGDYVDVTCPRLTLTPLGVFPRSKRLLVTGLFKMGAQPDANQAYVSLQTGQKLLGSKGRVDGLQIKTRELFAAPRIMA